MQKVFLFLFFLFKCLFQRMPSKHCAFHSCRHVGDIFQCTSLLEFVNLLVGCISIGFICLKNFIKKRACRRIFFRTTGAFSINIVSADSAQHDSENQNQHTDRHVDIFADRIIQIREFAASSLVYLGLHILLSADPIALETKVAR